MTYTLIVAGMHRSGTSLTANWLAHCGLYIGDKLLHRKTDNPMGHYEDLDFLNLHEEILAANGCTHLVPLNKTLSISEPLQMRAHQLVQARTDKLSWGWKDPRTALFLPFWKSLIPGLKVLVVYRHYASVADSLMRRERKSPAERKGWPKLEKRLSRRWQYSFGNRPLLRTYLQTWLRYNRDILQFTCTYPNDVLVIPIDQLPGLSSQIIGFLNANWGFELIANDIGNVMVDDQFHKAVPLLARQLARLAEPECVPVLAELDQLAQQSLRRLPLENECL